MTLEQTIGLFFCVAAVLALFTITLLVVDAYFANGKMRRRKKAAKPVRLKTRTPISGRIPMYYGKRARSLALLGMLGGMISGTVVASMPFIGGKRKNGCCYCGRCNRCRRRRGIRTYRF